MDNQRRSPATIFFLSAAVFIAATCASVAAVPDYGIVPTLPLSSVGEAMAVDPRVESSFVKPLEGVWTGSVFLSRFTVPDFWSGREIYLRLGTRRTAAHLFLDGFCIGAVPASAEFAEFDLTSVTNLYGGTNVLSVAMQRDPRQDDVVNPGEVLLYSAPPIELHRLEFVTLVSPDLLDAEAQIVLQVVKHPRPLSYRSVKRKAWMTAKLIGEGGREVARAEPRQLDLASDGVPAEYTTTMVIENPRVWREEDPFLYTLVVQVDADIRVAKVAVRESERSDVR